MTESLELKLRMPPALVKIIHHDLQVAGVKDHEMKQRLDRSAYMITQIAKNAEKQSTKLGLSSETIFMALSYLSMSQILGNELHPDNRQGRDIDELVINFGEVMRIITQTAVDECVGLYKQFPREVETE